MSVVRVVSIIWAIAVPALAFAQAQAASGNIEGTVKDGSGAELQGFWKYEQSGLTLSAGQTVVANIELGVGRGSSSPSEGRMDDATRRYALERRPDETTLRRNQSKARRLVGSSGRPAWARSAPWDRRAHRAATI